MHTDTYLQQISAAHLGVADVAVAVSHSGCSIDTVKALKQARKAGAGTIAITSPKEPLLGKYADVCLSTGGAPCPSMAVPSFHVSRIWRW